MPKSKAVAAFPVPGHSYIWGGQPVNKEPQRL